MVPSKQRGLRRHKPEALPRAQVQCHLFLAKISELLPPETGSIRVQELKGTGEELCRAFDGPEMPPPRPESRRKRAHSSHYSTGAQRGSERPTSSVSATDSSSSLHLEALSKGKRGV